MNEDQKYNRRENTYWMPQCAELVQDTAQRPDIPADTNTHMHKRKTTKGVYVQCCETQQKKNKEIKLNVSKLNTNYLYEINRSVQIRTYIYI